MIDLQTYVLILLAIAAVGMFYILRVFLKQKRLFKFRIEDRDVRHFRYVLFAISIVIIVCGLIPIGINIFTLLADESRRPDKVSLVSFVYSMGVHLQSLLLSYLLWQIYRLAGNSTDDQE